jgi:PAS domain S-box-containing protein
VNKDPQGSLRPPRSQRRPDDNRPEPSSDASSYASSGASVLLVDDHPANLVALEATLSPLGYRMVRANSGQEALKALLAEDFAVILLDVQMPIMDGFETAALIRARPRTSQIPIIFITAIHRDLPHIFQGYARGAADYLSKPFEPTVLRAKVAVFVDLYLREKRLEAQAAELREREREDQHRRGEQRVQQLVDSMPLALWALRGDGTLYYANRASTEYAGMLTDHKGDDGGGREAEGLVHPDDREQLRKAWDAASARGEALEAQCRLRRAEDGVFRWHVGRAVPERDESGAVTGWIVTAADIENQKKAEDEYAHLVDRERQARGEAEAASRAKDEFLATLSHELRTPLAAMVGWTRMLRTGNLTPEKSRKALETIERNAKAQADLIEDILDVSRIITGKLRLDIQALDLGAVVRGAIEAVRPAAEAKGIQVDSSIGALPPGLRGDSSRLQQVIWNLLSNAIKFTPAGGHVELTVDQLAPAVEASGAQPGTGGVRISVADNGRGIDPALAPYIFDRFRQADSTSQRAHGGLGLGLAIVRHLIELHGGTVEVESAGAQRGATFRLTLPARRDAEPGAPPETARRTPTASMPADSARTEPDVDLGGVRVLLVDDEPDARELFAEVLEQYGASVTGAGTADEALMLLREQRPTVLLSDIGLPGEDGLSLIRRVRALPAESGGRTPAAALTAYARAEDGHRSLAAGFQRHAVKPIQPAALAALVRELVDLHRAGTTPAPELARR